MRQDQIVATRRAVMVTLHAQLVGRDFTSLANTFPTFLNIHSWIAGLKIIFERWPVLITGQTNFSSVMSRLGQNIENTPFEEYPH